MNCRRIFLSLFVALLTTTSLHSQDRDFEKKVLPFLKQHCIECHGPEREEGGLRIDRLSWRVDDKDSVDLSSIDDLQNMLDEMVIGKMPPQDEPRPKPKAKLNPHKMSHKASGKLDPASIHQQRDRMLAELVSTFLTKLKETKEVDGSSLLDHSLVAYGSNLRHTI